MLPSESYTCPMDAPYSRSPLPAEFAAALTAARPELGPFAADPHYYQVIGSTNDVASALALGGAVEGTVVVADAQTTGRGRNRRTWYSPPGAGLYVSVVLRPGGDAPGGPGWARLITLAAGVAIADGIEAATGLPVQIKWPNDIVVSDRDAPTVAARQWRKLAGILAEGHTEGGALQHVVLGYGINVGLASYPGEIAGRASSLEAETGRSIDRGLVLARTLAALRREYGGLPRTPRADLLDRWRRYAPSARGARVRWEQNGAPMEGLSAGIDEEGALLIAAGGVTWRVAAGEVVWV